MALTNNWTDKIDGVDYNTADDINAVANAIIELEENVGDVESALDRIIEIQNTFIGG